MKTVKTLKYKNENINYRILYKKSPNIEFNIDSPRHIKVLVPKGTLKNKIKSEIKKNFFWIKSNLNKFKKDSSFLNCKEIFILGKKYKLIFIKNNINKIIFSKQHLIVNHKKINIDQFIKNFLKKKSIEIFNRELKRIIPKLHEIHTNPIIISRSMNKRWGSCCLSGRIILNTNLIFFPMNCIKYVIIHELCHFTHYNHSKDFWELLEKNYPKWKNAKKILDNYNYGNFI